MKKSTGGLSNNQDSTEELTLLSRLLDFKSIDVLVVWDGEDTKWMGWEGKEREGE